MGSDSWIIRLSTAADEDYRQILRWTVANFGKVQARSYAKIVTSVLHELTGAPSIIGAKERGDIGMNMWTIHVARKGRKGRHFVVFRVSNVQGRNTIEVLRLLHDSMDLDRHVSTQDD
ncbi:MAG: type II toxin-antitoxin system RelE/ParE family toxin [Burkholderiales bacterium]